MNTYRRLLLLLVFVIFSHTTIASSMDVSLVRCKKGVVKIGDDKFSALERCGKPTYTELLSGSNEPRLEKLLFKRKRKHTIEMQIYKGKIQRMSLIKL